MSFKGIIIGSAAALALIAAAAPASALNVAYVTQNAPWGQSTNETALTTAFGAFTRLNSFSNSMFSSGYDFIFVDGGDGNPNFETWLSGGGTAAAEAWVNSGGALFLNAAPNYTTSGPMLTGFGSAINYPAFSGTATITAAGQAVGLNTGAGVNFTGNSFSHASVTLGSGMTSLIEGESGSILASGFYGAGHLTVGGQTTTNWHSGGNPMQLRVNELQYAATGSNIGAVPEPASWALMIGGFGLAGAALRRRRTVAA